MVMLGLSSTVVALMHFTRRQIHNQAGGVLSRIRCCAWIVNSADEGVRVDKWLKHHVQHIPFSVLQRHIREKKIAVCSAEEAQRQLPLDEQGKIAQEIKLNFRPRVQRVKPSDRLASGMMLVYPLFQAQEKAREEIRHPQRPTISTRLQGAIKKLEKSVIYEDDDFIAINKPPGLAVQDGSAMSISIQRLLEAGAFSSRCASAPKLLHRLDKEVSGVLILAKTTLASRQMHELFISRKVRKTYLAKVQGVPQMGASERFVSTVYVEKVGKSSERLGMRSGTETGESAKSQTAITSHRVLTTSEKTSIVELEPITGRKHQLRLFCAKILLCPIFGDTRYGFNRNLKSLPQYQKKSHNHTIGGDNNHSYVYLHAQKIEFEQFRTGQKVEIIAALPNHMKKEM